MIEPLTFVTWRWQPKPGYRSTYPVEAVYALHDMIARHYNHSFRFVCVTDRPHELTDVEAIQLWPDLADVPSPFGRSYPSCYRRLKVFAPDAGEMFGPRLVSMDLDMVILADITPLFDRPEDFVIWGESDFSKQACNGSLWMLRTGSRPKVWTEFDPKTSPKVAASAGARGSDQAWLSYMLGKEAKWGKKDGVYSFRKDIQRNGGQVPKDARVIAFHGKTDPWGYQAMQLPWIREHYRMRQTA